MRYITYQKEYPGIVNGLFLPVVVEYAGRKIEVLGVWDTGATISCITQLVIEQLNIPINNDGCINDHESKRPTGIYYLDVTIDRFITFKGLKTIYSSFVKHNIGFIIGMDIIQTGNFSINNSTGKTILTYSVPCVGDNFSFPLEDCDPMSWDVLRTH